MRRLLSAAALLALAGAACNASPRADGGGRFVAQRVAKKTTTLVSGPALATYCEPESTLVVIAVGRAWSGGFAIRARLPLTAPRDFRVQAALAEVGSATAAFRPLKPGSALLGVGGTVHLEPADAVTGTFDVAVPDSGRLTASVRGTLTRIPLSFIRTGACSRG